MSYVWNTVPSHSSFDLLVLLAGAALKATLLLAVVALLCLTLRRLSAATRHLLWTLSLGAALLLPFLSAIAVWDVPVLPAPLSSLSPAPMTQLTGTAVEPERLPEEGLRRSLKVSPEIISSEPEIYGAEPPLNPVGSRFQLAKASAVPAQTQQNSATFLSAIVDWALAVWFVGVLLFLCKLLVGLIATSSLTRGAVEFKDPKMSGLFSALLTELQLTGRVRLLRSERTLMPVVCGVFHPTVLLPASADDWSEERSRMVLLHELTHVTRRDCLTQMLAQIACAFYWFNPVVWHAAKRLRVEREQACDDYVLSIGTKASDYAHHLLEIARYLQERSVFQWSQTTTVAMARRSQLEGRLLAILSKENKRRAMSQAVTAGVTALLLLLFSALAVVRPTISGAQNRPSPETALSDDANASEESSADLSSKKMAEERDERKAINDRPPELSVAQEPVAPADNNARAETSNDAQPASQATAASAPAIESEVSAPTAPRPESFPLPPAMMEAVRPVVPFIKAAYRQERQSETQDKDGDFIDEMAAVGYTNLSIKELVSLKVSGVNANYVRSLQALGLGPLTTKDLASMRLHDVTPPFIQSIRNAGFKELTTKELVSFSMHGVTPEFINRLRSAGYGNLSAKQLIDFGIYEVTPEFINSMRAIGFSNLSPKELVTLRVHAITPEFIRASRKRLGDLTLKQIIALKIGGLLEDSDKE